MKNKKLILIGIVVVLVVGIAAYFIGKGGKSSEEDQLMPKIQSVSSAPKIEVIGVEGLQMTVELNKEHWERVDALSLVVKVKNTGGKTLQRVVITQSLYDKGGGVITQKSMIGEVTQLKPGETATKNLDMIAINAGEKIGKVEMGFREVVWAAATTSVPTASTPKPTASPKPTETPITPVAGTYNASNYPKNPVEPGEVLAAFYFLLKEGKYLDAARLVEGMEPLIESGKIKEADVKRELRLQEIRNYIAGLSIIKRNYILDKPRDWQSRNLVDGGSMSLQGAQVHRQWLVRLPL